MNPDARELTDLADAAELVDRLRAESPGVERADDVVDRSALAAAADLDGSLDLAWAHLDSPIGPLWAAATEVGVVRLGFGDPSDDDLTALARHVSPRLLEHPPRLDPLRQQLEEYFAGARRRFDVSLDRRLIGGFRSEVLTVLEQVEFGQTVSYAELAARSGRSRAVRAVGTAMARNPLPIVVPCHRVLRTGGHLGGYAGGLDAKRWLLTHEGAGPPAA